MSQYRYAFAVGRIRALENKLLTPERLQRMVDATSAEEAYRLLTEAGYGTPGEQVIDFEQQISYELQKVVMLMKELDADPELIDLLYLHYDLHNIKSLYKERFAAEQKVIDLSVLGKIPLETLTKAMSESNYDELPKPFQEKLQKADKEMIDQIDPGRLDAWLDQAYYQTILDASKKHRSVFLKDYFALSADFNNLLMALRLHAMSLDHAIFEELYLPGGSLAISDLTPIFSNELTEKSFAGSRFSKHLISAYHEYKSQGFKLAILEKNRDNFLFKLASETDQGSVSIGPVLRYLLAREQEAKAIRLILTGKLNHVNDKLISERVRELYA